MTKILLIIYKYTQRGSRSLLLFLYKNNLNEDTKWLIIGGCSVYSLIYNFKTFMDFFFPTPHS